MPRARHRAPHPLAGAAPKSKMTSYAFFVQLCREEHRRVHPDEEVLFAEFGRKCAERWKTMSELEKKRFNQMAEEDAKRYHLEMAAFEAGREAAARRGLHQRKRHELAFNSPPPTEHPTNPALNPDGTRKRKKRKKKDPNAPKRAMYVVDFETVSYLGLGYLWKFFFQVGVFLVFARRAGQGSGGQSGLWCR